MHQYRLPKQTSDGIPGGKESPQTRLCIALPDVAPVQFHRLSEEDAGIRQAVTRWQYQLDQTALLSGQQEFGVVAQLSIEHQAAERRTAFARDVWKRDKSAIRQVVVATNPEGLVDNLFNKYTTSQPTRIERDTPMWADGTSDVVTMIYEPEPAPLVIFSREPVSGFAIAGESLKGRMRQAVVTKIVRRTNTGSNTSASITFINEQGLFAPGYRPRLGHGPEMNLASLTLNADGTIASYMEVQEDTDQLPALVD